jgi:hypothetical protein
VCALYMHNLCSKRKQKRFFSQMACSTCSPEKALHRAFPGLEDVFVDGEGWRGCQSHQRKFSHGSFFYNNTLCQGRICFGGVCSDTLCCGRFCFGRFFSGTLCHARLRP